jgi:hypothetical protein
MRLINRSESAPAGMAPGRAARALYFVHRRRAATICFLCLMFMAAFPTKILAQQNCTTDPFSQQLLPLCGSVGGGTPTTVSPEDLLEFTKSSSGSWSVLDISQITGVQVLGAPPSGIQIGANYYVFAPNGTNGDLEAFTRNICGQWQVTDLSAALSQTGVAVPTAIVTPGNVIHVYAVNNNQRLLDFSRAPANGWTVTDVTSAVGIASGSSLSPLGQVAVVQIGSGIHVYNTVNTGSSQVLEEYFLPAGGSWVFTNVTTAAESSVALSSTSLAATTFGTAAEVYMSSTSGHIINFQGSDFTSSGGTWQEFDQTANSGGSAIFSDASDIPVDASAINVGSSLDIFINGGTNGVTDLTQLIETNGQWQVNNLSTIASNGKALVGLAEPFALMEGSNVAVYAAGASGHLLEFFNSSGSTWTTTDVSAATGATLLGIGTTAFDESNQVQVFGNGPSLSTASTQPKGCSTPRGAAVVQALIKLLAK